MATSTSDKTRETSGQATLPVPPTMAIRAASSLDAALSSSTTLQTSSPFSANDSKAETEKIPQVPALIIDSKEMQRIVEGILHVPTKNILQQTLHQAHIFINAFEQERQDPFLGGAGLAAHQNAAQILSQLEAFIVNDRAKLKGPDATSKRYADTIFNRIEKACQTVKAKLILPSKDSKSIPEPLWKTHRLRLEQTLLLEGTLGTAFNQTLEKIAAKARPYTPPKSVFICYAWPNLKSEREAHLTWIQPFLIGLRKHLHQAGLATVKLDIMDGQLGGNINAYMQSAQTSEFVLFIGTESLLSHHEMGLSAVCTELVHLRRKRLEDKKTGQGNRVFPILLSGDYDHAFPPEFDRYSTVSEWNGDHKTYFDHLSGLISALYSTDKEAFEVIWQGFLQALSSDQRILITQGLKQTAIETRLAEEAAKKKTDEEASNRAAGPLLKLDGAVEMKEIKRPSSLFEQTEPSGDSWHLPSRNDRHFTGRVAELKKLNAAFSTQKECKTMVLSAVSGLGGVGKTQLAIYHIYHPEHPYALRIWFQAETATTLHKDFLEFAQTYQLPIEEKAPRSELIKAVKRYLAKQSSWLVVYDNAGSYSEISDFLLDELNNGHRIITTRRTEWHDIGDKLEVNVFSEAEAIAYIRKLLQRDETHYKQSEEVALTDLVRELGYLPLALAQAGAYIKKRNKTIENYLAMYRTQTAAMLADKTLPIDSKVQPVATTWNISLQAIEEDEAAEIKETGELKLSLRILQAMSYLHSGHIPLDLLARWLQTAEFVQDKSVIERLLDKALGYLAAYSMIQAHLDSRTVSVHRLVQEVVRFQLQQTKSTVPAVTSLDSKGDAKSAPSAEKSLHLFLLDSLTDSCLEEFTLKVHVLEDEKRQKALLPHLQALVKHHDASSNTNTFSSADLGRLLVSIGNVFGKLSGDADQAKVYYERALKIQEQHCGKDHWEVALTLNNLANACGALGDVQTQKKLLERALKIQEQHPGKDPWEVARTLNNLANAWGALGNVQTQKILLEQAVKIKEQHYGKDHWEVALTLNNLANTCGVLGDIQTQKMLLERTLKIKEQHYGKDHWQVAVALYNLANTYGALKDAQTQKTLLEHALRIQEQHYGKDHREVARTLNNLGTAYHQLGDISTALSHAQRSYRILTASFKNPDHPHIKMARRNLEHLQSIKQLVNNLCQPTILTLLQQGDIETACYYFESENADMADFQLHLYLARHYGEQKNYLGAIAHLELALSFAQTEKEPDARLRQLHVQLACAYLCHHTVLKQAKKPLTEQQQTEIFAKQHFDAAMKSLTDLKALDESVLSSQTACYKAMMAKAVNGDLIAVREVFEAYMNMLLTSPLSPSPGDAKTTVSERKQIATVSTDPSPSVKLSDNPYRFAAARTQTSEVKAASPVQQTVEFIEEGELQQALQLSLSLNQRIGQQDTQNGEEETESDDARLQRAIQMSLGQ